MPPPRGRFHFSSATLWSAAGLLALLALLMGLAVREDYWLDEGYTVRRVNSTWRQLITPFVFRPSEPVHPFDRRDVYDLNPPVYFAAIRLLAGADPGRLGVRLFSILPLVLGLLALADWARRALGGRGQLAVVAIGATAPAMIYYGTEARPYAFPFGLACLLLWLGPRLWRRPPALAAACALVAAGGCLSHFAFAWWIITEWLIFGMIYVQARQGAETVNRRAAAAGMFGLAAGSAAALLVILPQWATIRECSHASSQILAPAVLMNTIGLPFSRVGIAPLPPALCLGLQLAVLAVLAVLLRDSPRHEQGTLFLALWLFPIALPVIIKYWFNPAFFERYTFFSLAGWLMMLAWIAQEAAERRGWRRVMIGAIFLALLAANLTWAILNLGHPLRQEWTPLLRLMEEKIRPDEYYSCDPYSMRVIFAVNARTPPAGRYADIREGPPPPAGTAMWVISDCVWNKGGLRGYDPPDWRKQKVAEANGLELYRLERLRAGPPRTSPFVFRP